MAPRPQNEVESGQATEAGLRSLVAEVIATMEDSPEKSELLSQLNSSIGNPRAIAFILAHALILRNRDDAERLKSLMTAFELADAAEYAQLNEEARARVDRAVAILNKSELTHEDRVQFILDTSNPESGLTPDDAAVIASSPTTNARLNQLQQDIPATTQAIIEREADANRQRSIIASPNSTETERTNSKVNLRTNGAIVNGDEADFIRRAGGYFPEVYAALSSRQRAQIDAMASDGQNASDRDIAVAVSRAVQIFGAADETRLNNARRDPNTQDGAAVRIVTLLAAHVALDNLVERSAEISRMRPKDQQLTLMREMRSAYPELNNASDVVLQGIAQRIIAERSANPNLTAAEIARRAADSATAAAIGLASNRLAVERFTGENILSVEDERYKRNVEGYSFIETELGDLAAAINTHDSNLAAALGRQLGDRNSSLTSQEMLQALENAGIVSAWTATGDNRVASWDVPNRGAFNTWNNENFRRLNLDGNDQLSGREIHEAMRLARYIQDNPDVMAALRNVNITNLSKHDINRDGTVDTTEAARVLMLRGISDPTRIDSTQELNAILQAAPALVQTQSRT